MRNFLALCLFAFLFCMPVQKAEANCTAPCTKAQVTTDINTNWPDNTSQLITPALLRSTVLDLVNSYLDANGSSSFTCQSGQFFTAVATLSTYTCAAVSVAGLSGIGTGVAAALANSVGSAGAFVVFNGAGGTPTSLALANATGCTISGCVSGLGTNIAAALALNLSAAGGVTSTIASGTATLGTAAIASTACAAVVTVAATNVLTTDVVMASFNGDPSAVTGYTPAVTGMLTIFIYPTANNVNFKVCNGTTASITPGAITLNWRVSR